MAEPTNTLRIPETLMKVKSLLGIFSAKGGVGKSMISLNLARSLRDKGYKVGLVDGDIYGPSQPVMIKATDITLEVNQEKTIKPLVLEEISFMSMGLISSEKMPVIWRGPMVSGAVMQLLSQTDWGELDYLIIDTPPGTGDIQLTLMQRMPITAALVITTPEDVSVSDTRKGIEMIKKLSVPLIGIVENMSYFKCTECDKSHYIFGKGGGNRLAQEYKVDLLGTLPLLTIENKSTILDDHICKEEFIKISSMVEHKIKLLKKITSEGIPQTNIRD